MAAEGKTAPEIATELHISPRTAESHRASIMKKLGLQNQTDLIRHAIRHGLLPPGTVISQFVSVVFLSLLFKYLYGYLM